MKYLLTISFLLSSLFAFTQEKGVTPLSSPSADGGGQEGATYAVVVGISDYQDEDIPDLQYAHRDAEAFANFLRSPAGGGLDEDHLKVLLNEQATTAQFDAALGWLLDEAKEGDQVIIYFSGHGDVENRTRSQQGFLLCWDSPSRAYVAGAYPIFFLKEVIATLSLENKTRVQVITDACRAGKLAGNEIGGSQLTSQNLAQQYANEIKILSCQPDEYSLEGEQWGGGRGAFSYHLVDGLYGLADRNGDGTVTLMELRGYLEERVSEEVAPESQFPMTVGNSREELARVYPELLEKLEEGRRGQLQMFTGTESRGIVDEALSQVDSSVRKTYYAFQQALDDKRFLQPKAACADAYYEQLIAEPGLARLHNSLRRNYAAALQDDAQQELNMILKTGLTAFDRKAQTNKAAYRDYPGLLQRAAELLGENHYMYPMLQARKTFFQGTLYNDRTKKKQTFREALRWQPDMPHALVQMITLFEAGQPDSARYYAQEAMRRYPTWVRPWTQLAKFYRYSMKDRTKEEEMLIKAGQVDSTSEAVMYAKGNYYKRIGDYEQAKYWYEKAVAHASEEICFPCAYLNLGFLLNRDPFNDLAGAEQYFLKAIELDTIVENTAGYCTACSYNNLGIVYRRLKKHEKAEVQFLKAIEIDSANWRAYNNLGIIYRDLRQFEKAEIQYKKVLQWDSTNAEVCLNLGLTYKKAGLYEKAATYLKKATQLDSTDRKAYLNLADVYQKTRRYQEAEELLQKLLQLDSTDIETYNDLGIIYNSTGRSEEAIECYNKAIELDSTDWRVYGNLGIAYVNTDRYEEAMECFNKAIELDSTHWQVYANLGGLNQRLQRWEAAEIAFRKAIQMAPPIGLLFTLRGNAYTHIPGHMEEAKELLEKGLEMSPDSPKVYIFLALWYIKNDQLEQAWNYTEMALKKGYKEYDWLQEENDLVPLRRDTARWQALMDQYFPEGSDD